MSVLTVNRLPVPTWNSLRVNSATVELPESFAETEPGITLPQGVECETKDIKSALEETERLVEKLPEETIVAGKQPIYNEQHFGTALGKNFTELINRTTEKVRVLRIPEGFAADGPIIIRLDMENSESLAEQYFVIAGSGSKADILFVRGSEKPAEGVLLSEVKAVLGKGAKLRVFDVNLTGTGFTVLDDFAASLGENAEFVFTQLLLGGKKTFTGCKADQYGNKSVFEINTGYLAENGQVLDINYHTVQRGKSTDSKIAVKGSLRTAARKTFRGTIDFRKGSTGSTGDEQEDVLLFDDDVVNKTVPVILTEEEDVKGRHGGSMGNLAQETLFYMGTRGIDKQYAQMLITKGRLVSIAHTIPHEETIGRVNGFIREAFSD